MSTQSKDTGKAEEAEPEESGPINGTRSHHDRTFLDRSIHNDNAGCFRGRGSDDEMHETFNSVYSHEVTVVH